MQPLAPWGECKISFQYLESYKALAPLEAYAGFGLQMGSAEGDGCVFTPRTRNRVADPLPRGSRGCGQGGPVPSCSGLRPIPLGQALELGHGGLFTVETTSLH